MSEVPEGEESDEEGDEEKNNENEKLVRRLYKASEKFIEEDQGHANAGENVQPNQAILGEQNKAMIEAHTSQGGKSTFNYEAWVRTKDHQEKLKKSLVWEAKKDMYEKLVMKQAELDQQN